MRFATNPLAGERPAPTPGSTPQRPAVGSAGISAPAGSAVPVPEPTSSPTPIDQIGQRGERASASPGPIDALGSWARNEWSTVAGAAHGLAATPGIVSKAWLEAAATNRRLGAAISDTVETWERTPPAQRQVAIDALAAAAAHVSPAASAVAAELGAANGTPGGSLATPVADRARAAAGVFEAAAAAQAGHAASPLHAASRLAGASPADLLARAGDAASGAGRELAAVVARAPYVGLALAATGALHDARAGTSPAAAALANLGGAVAGQVAGELAATGIGAAVSGAALADTGAAAAGVALATGPVGWAVAGGVIVGAAVGYAVYKAAESPAGQHAVDATVGVVGGAAESAIRELRG